MDQTLVAVAASQGGYLFRHQLLDLGLTDRQLAGAVRAGELARIRHGTYVPAPLWRNIDAAERHAVVTRSVLDKLGPGVVASHVSSAVLHGLDVFGADLDAVHLTRLDGRTGRREAGVVYHQNALADEAVANVEGRQVTVPWRAVMETCADLDVEAAMVTTSSALRRGDVTAQELEEAIVHIRHWPGASRARLAVLLSDGRLESVGEARSLHLMWSFGIPHPDLQLELRRGTRLVGRSDFGWLAWRHVGEFDGMVKYGRFNPHRADPGRAIEQEKVREDDIRSLGLGMTRWTWSDLDPATRCATAERIRRGMEQSRRLYSREPRSFAT